MQSNFSQFMVFVNASCIFAFNWYCDNAIKMDFRDIQIVFIGICGVGKYGYSRTHWQSEIIRNLKIPS